MRLKRKTILASIASLVFAFGGLGAVTTIILTTSVVSVQDAVADSLSCSTSFGTTNCSGSGGSTSCSTSFGTTNCSGPRGSTSCSTSFGTTNCSGSGGSTSCSTSFGTTNCSGSGGSTSCSTSFGTTNCSGTKGSYSCSESFGTTNCSGSGIDYIPKPTPTPTKSYVYTYPTPTPTKSYVYTYPTPTPTKSYVYTYPTPTPTKSYVYTYPTPTPKAVSAKTTQVCINLSGVTESCRVYPTFYIEYCSASSGGTLQWKSLNSWVDLWKISGVKNSRCTAPGNPYYTLVEGELKSVVGISLRVVVNPVNGVTPSPDLLKVTVK